MIIQSLWIGPEVPPVGSPVQMRGPEGAWGHPGCGSNWGKTRQERQENTCILQVFPHWSSSQLLHPEWSGSAPGHGTQYAVWVATHGSGVIGTLSVCMLTIAPPRSGQFWTVFGMPIQWPSDHGPCVFFVDVSVAFIFYTMRTCLFKNMNYIHHGTPLMARNATTNRSGSRPSTPVGS